MVHHIHSSCSCQLSLESSHRTFLFLSFSPSPSIPCSITASFINIPSPLSQHPIQLSENAAMCFPLFGQSFCLSFLFLSFSCQLPYTCVTYYHYKLPSITRAENSKLTSSSSASCSLSRSWRVHGLPFLPSEAPFVLIDRDWFGVSG